MRAVPLLLALAACSGSTEAAGGGGAGSGGTGSGGTGSGGTGSGGAGSGGAGSGGAGSGGAAGAGGQSQCDVLGVPGACLDVAACTAAEHHPTPGFCPGPASVQCCIPYGLALCDPSVVALPNEGNTTEAPGEGGCPDGMLLVADAGLGAFCVDRYEASLVLQSGQSFSPYLNPGTEAVRAVSVAGAVPQGYVSGAEADDACTLAGKRLCTDAEWLRACRGPSGSTYPYGDVLALGVCNDHRSLHPAIEYFGTSDAWIYSEIDNACINQLPQTVDPTGQNPGCATAEGALDMMGNLHEWTADPAGTFRGGFYVDTVLNGPGCLYATTAHDTSHWDYSTGFRCCSNP